ncbi:acyl-CoA N-acyltransferase [Xylaria grammica]|nr:acyl-CoA N-acyltransferase [Xylaria grammica]
MASIRARKDDDLPACVEILKAVYRSSGYPVGGVDHALDELRTDDQAWVAEDDAGAVVGHVAMNRAREDYANRGAATGLVRAVEAEARGQGRRLLILALVKDQDAIRLYRRLGWEYYGTVAFCWGEGNEMDAECFVSPLA